jgi:hypothetical protein
MDVWPGSYHHSCYYEAVLWEKANPEGKNFLKKGNGVVVLGSHRVALQVFRAETKGLDFDIFRRKDRPKQNPAV